MNKTFEKFDIQSAAYHRNPYPTLERLRAGGPMIESKLPVLGKVHFATSYAAVSDFLKGANKFAADGRSVGQSRALGIRWLPRTFRILTQNMLQLDDPDHRRLRKLVDAPFHHSWIDNYRPKIEKLSEQLLDRVEARNERDIVGGFARALPLEVICEILGLAGDRRQFMEWMSNFSGEFNAWKVISISWTLKKMMNYLRKEIERARVEQHSGLLTVIINAEADGERMTEDELLAMVFLLFIAGHETTVHLLSTGIYTLLNYPDQLQMLMADWSLAPRAVEEMLRYASPVQFTKPRMAREDMEFHGCQLKKGDKIMAMLAAANVDPAAFNDPLRFDIVRDDENRHVGFGGGLHICLGIHLARAEAQIALRQLFTRWPRVRLAVPDDQLEWQNRLGMHGFRTLPLVWS